MSMPFCWFVGGKAQGERVECVGLQADITDVRSQLAKIPLRAGVGNSARQGADMSKGSACAGRLPMPKLH